MKIIIMSDTHGAEDSIIKVKQAHPDADAFIHCGDSELLPTHAALKNMHCVRGNCDYTDDFPNELVLPIGDEVIYITHGHLQGVNQSLLPLIYRGQELGATLICYGHTHQLGAEKLHDIVVMNAGSLEQSRSKYPESYAVVEKHGNTWKITFVFENDTLKISL